MEPKPMRSTPTPLLSAALLATALAVTTAAQGVTKTPTSPGEAEKGGCGTRVAPEDVPLVRELQELGMYTLDGVPEYTLAVPMTFHFVRTDAGFGAITEAEGDQNFADLNAGFADAGISFFRAGPIDFIDDSTFYSGMTTQAEIDQLRGMNVVPDTINVYFVSRFEQGGEPLCGQASFTHNAVQGIVMDYDCTASADNHSTFVHEVGHYFDALHTHDTQFGEECPDGSNCGTAGDLVCDTPADPNLDGLVADCTYFGSAMRCGDSFSPPVSNFMSYAPKSCRVTFTPTQNQRMLATLINLRPELFGTALNVIWIDWNYTGILEFGSYRFPYDTLTEGLAAAGSGALVVIKAGASSGTITIDQNVVVDSFRGSATIGQ